VKRTSFFASGAATAALAFGSPAAAEPDSRHSLGGVPSVALGPNPGILASDWMLDMFAGKAMVSERWFVDPSGRVTTSQY